MARPTRQDISIMSGARNIKQWTLFSNNVPVNITNDLVTVFISKKRGQQYSIKVSSTAGLHFNGPNGIVRFNLNSDIAPANPIFEIWWYELHRLPFGQTDWITHIVGEIAVIPSGRA